MKKILKFFVIFLIILQSCYSPNFVNVEFYRKKFLQTTCCETKDSKTEILLDGIPNKPILEDNFFLFPSINNIFDDKVKMDIKIESFICPKLGTSKLIIYSLLQDISFSFPFFIKATKTNTLLESWKTHSFEKNNYELEPEIIGKPAWGENEEYAGGFSSVLQHLRFDVIKKSETEKVINNYFKLTLSYKKGVNNKKFERNFKVTSIIKL